MIKFTKTLRKGVLLLLFAILCLPQAAMTQDSNKTTRIASSSNNEIIVSARRKAEKVQDIPLSIQVIASEDIEFKKISEGIDIAMNTPGVTFNKSLGSGANWTLRGVGVSAIGAASTAPVQTALNGHVVSANSFGDAGFLDTAGIEILEGPQGTLYGRNTTAGLINLTSARPGSGNYIKLGFAHDAYFSFKGAADFDILDNLLARVAWSSLSKDGTIKNIYNNTKIDDRKYISARVSVDWLLADAHTIEFNTEYHQNDDARLNEANTACSQDDFFGCAPWELGTRGHTSDYRGTFGAGVAQIALLNATNANLYAGTITPSSINEVNRNTNPEHKQELTIVQLAHIWDINDSLTNTVKYTFAKRDYQHVDDNDLSVATTPFTAPIPRSHFICGDPIENVSFASSRECSQAVSDTHQVEVNLTSDFTGKHNFTVGAYYYLDRTKNNYYVQLAESDVIRNFSLNPLSALFTGGISLNEFGGIPFYTTFATAVATQTATASTTAGVPVNILDPSDPNFNTTNLQAVYDAVIAADHAPTFLPLELAGLLNRDEPTQENTAVYGEYYYDVTDSLQLTLGARAQNSITSTDVFSSLLDQNYNGTTQNFDPSLTDQATKQRASDSLDMYKVVLEQEFDFGMAYVSLTTGARGGGANPGGALFNKPTYDKEEVKNIEIGSRNTLFDDALILNATLFQTQFDNSQISLVRATSAITEGIDYTNNGLNLGFKYHISDTTSIEASVLLLDSKMAQQSVSDPNNPLQSTQIIGSTASGAEALAGTAFGGALTPTMNCLINGVGPGCTADASWATATIAQTDTGFVAKKSGALVALSAERPHNLKDNRFPMAPELDYSVSLNHVFRIGNANLESTLNYVYKGDRHASIFNYDFLKVKSQDYLNLYLSYVPDNSQWKLNVWGKNLEDKRSVVGIRTGSSLQGGVNFLTYDQGRQIGAEFEYKF